VRLLLIVIGCGLAIPADALAKPKLTLAVAPLKGDAGNQIGNAVVDALAGKDFVVIAPRETGRERKKLGLPSDLDGKAARKLARSLEAVAVLSGDVRKVGKRRALHLVIHRRGKPDDDLTIEFRTARSDKFRRTLREVIVKKLDGATDQAPTDDDDDDARRLAARLASEDDERKRKPARDDEAAEPATRTARDDAPVGKRPRADADAAPARRKRVAEPDDEPAVRRRRARRDQDPEPTPRVLARASVGPAVGQRRLTFDTRAGLTALQTPPRVITTAPAARVDAELYPIALASPRSPAAGLGVAASYHKTFGLSIQVPNQALRSPVDQARYAIGARYRLAIGDATSLAFGLDYHRQRYLLDRGPLMGVALDAPDVDYTAIAPGVSARTPLGDRLAVFGGVAGMLVLDTGGIQDNASYGPATVYGLDVVAGVDLAFTRQIGVRVALAYNQMSLAFNGKGTLANNRDADAASIDVNGATDRLIDLTATLGVSY
jgi:hypothetical protein